MRKTISEAVILMAGSGSRLRSAGENCLKPLLPLLGRPLISYTLDALKKVGIKNIYAVVGFEGESLRADVKALIPSNLKVCWIDNPDWRKQNGISVLAAAPQVTAPFLLTMGDHLFEQLIVDLLLREVKPDRLNLAIDKKLDSIFDLNDAMKVRMRGDQVVAIGKDLQDYDAVDTGLFVCPREFFDYLERAKRNGDCSLADGVRLMAADDQVRGIDIGPAWWQDVDTPEMLACAAQHLRTRTRRQDTEAVSASTQPSDKSEQ
jgi:1L-myo-inositol 1-phosphate cytidylyltransferase